MKLLALTLGLALSQAPATQAAMIWSGIQDIALPTDFNGVFVNLNTADASTSTDLDYLTSDINFFFGGDGIGTGPQLLPARAGTGATDLIILVPFGSTIDASLNYGPADFGASQGHVGPGPAQFASGSQGFIAFQYDAPGTGSYTFGWMRVTLTNGSSPGILHEWAFSDIPGQTAFVGVIPEPSLPTLALATGALALLRRKRR